MQKVTTHATITSFINQENEKAVLMSVMVFINNLPIVNTKKDDIKMVLSEAIRNVIMYAYPSKQGNISIYISVLDNKILKIQVKDWGCGIKDVNTATMPSFENDGNHLGMGFLFMNAFCDELTVNSILGKGTTVITKFKIL